MTVPIVPGNPEPQEPQPQTFAAQPYSAPPAYSPTPPYSAPPLQPPQPGDVQNTAKKAAVGTVTVLAVLVGIFCVLPMLACAGLSLLGSVSSAGR